MFHYLTATNGIPHMFMSMPPGMEQHNLVSETREDLAAALQGLVDILRHPSPRRLTLPDELTASCSDSQYP